MERSVSLRQGWQAILGKTGLWNTVDDAFGGGPSANEGEMPHTLQGTMGQENQTELPRAEVTKSVTKLSRGKEAVYNLADEMAQKERSGFRRSSPRRM